MAISVKGITVSRHLLLRRIRARRLLMNSLHRPSFFAYLERRKRYWASLVRMKGLESEIYPEFSKWRGRELADSAGVRTPRLLGGPVSVDDLKLDDYGADFVIKPNWGTSSRGVLVLHKVSSHRYVNLIDGKEFDVSGVRRFIRESVGASGRGTVDDLLVEESMAIGTRRPTEWKIYTFYGDIGLIQQNDRTGIVIRSKMYSPDWQDLGRIRIDRKLESGLEMPSDAPGVLEAARAVSAHVPTGFTRVDLFESPDGGDVIFGEVCLIPGGHLYFGRGLDRELGTMWDSANTRLLAEERPLIP